MQKNDDLDDDILAIVEAGVRRRGDIVLVAIAERVVQGSRSANDKTVERSLQRLRKQGRVMFGAQGRGWIPA